MKYKNNISEIVDEKSSLETNLKKIYEFIDDDNELLLKNFIKDLHNADIAELIQNLDGEILLNFILKIKSDFDPEILTYLNEVLEMKSLIY